MLRRLWQIVVGLLALLGLVTALIVALVTLAGVSLWREVAGLAVEVPERLVLTVDLRGTLADRSEPAPWTLFQREPALDLTDTVIALDQAARDPRVRGILARIDATAHGLAAAQELHDAVRRLRAAGKFAFAHADSIGALDPGNEGYLLASAFERIVLGPAGAIGLTGLSIEIPYLGGLLERLGIDAEIVQREDYKTAFESFVAREPSRAQIEMTNALLDRIEAGWLEAIADGRGLAPDRLRDIVDGGPWTAEEALAHGLVDAIGPLDEVEELAKRQAGGEAELWPIGRWAAAVRREQAEAEVLARVAVVRVSGAIGLPLEDTAGVDADELVGILDDAAEDEDIDAVLLRLDSPGGSPVAAAAVAHAIARLRDSGRPVVVSLANVGASGGYWIAAAADRILAWPGTLTGSIGVIAGKPVLARLWQQLDVHWARFTRGGHAGFASPNQPWQPGERERIEALTDWLYQRFLEHVAAGRGTTPEAIRRIAGGRVYTGEEALQLGLVDRLGGVLEACAMLRELLGLPAEAPLELVRYPADELDPRRLARLFERLPLVQEVRLSLPAAPALPLALAPPVRIR